MHTVCLRWVGERPRRVMVDVREDEEGTPACADARHLRGAGRREPDQVRTPTRCVICAPATIGQVVAFLNSRAAPVNVAGGCSPGGAGRPWSRARRHPGRRQAGSLMSTPAAPLTCPRWGAVGPGQRAVCSTAEVRPR